MKGFLLLAGSAAGFSTLAICMKLAFEEGVNLPTLLTIRFLSAAVFCFAFLILRRETVKADFQSLCRMIGLGAIVYVAVSGFYALAISRLPASTTALVFYTFPAIVVGLSILTGREMINLPRLAALGACFAGLFQVLGFSFETISGYGVMFGMAAAFSQACYVLLSHMIVSKLPPLLMTAYASVGTGMVFAVYGLTAGELTIQLTLLAWVAVLSTGFLASFLGIWLFFAGVKEAGPSNASIIMNIEPVLTVILSVLVLGETLGWMQGLGGALIIGGLIFLQWAEAMK